MDMPARIMAEQIGIAKKDGQSFGVGRWIADEAAPNATTYTRADLHDALAAENERLRDALALVLAWHDKDKHTAGQITLERSNAFAKARAAMGPSRHN